MNTIIFKSEKNAKSYEVRAMVNFHIYGKGELIYKVRTDDTSRLCQDYRRGQVEFIEITN